MSDRATANGAMPAAALKRFADDLKTNETGSRFLEENLKRVDAFINKPNTVDLELDPRVEDQLAENTDIRDINTKSRSPEEKAAFRKQYWQSRGINDYDFDQSHKNNAMMDLQKFPEMSTALGPRSRFGEGDGSFMDRWITTPTKDPSVSAYPLNGDVIPPFTGFKRHINTFKHGPLKQTEAYRTIKPYAVRREERLEKERKEREKRTGVNVGPQSTGRYIHEGISSPDKETENKTALTEADDTTQSQPLPKDQAFLTLPPLSDADRDTYFGAKARMAFFDFYHQLSRMRNMTTYGSTTELLRGFDSDGEEEAIDTGRGHAPSLPPLSKGKQKGKIASDEAIEVGSDEKEKGDDKEQGFEDETGNKDEGDVLDDGISTTTPIEAETTSANVSKPPDDPGTFRPSSARSRFIAQCVEHDIGPMPALIIRKGVSSELNLRSQNMGDTVAVKLASSFQVMPHLQHLNVSDNGLTDPGLSAIICSLHDCKYLLSLDIGRNKIDIEAAQALGEYLQSTDCCLSRLGLQNADIDDMEASKFVEAIAVKNTIQYLDMSRNLLGTQENKASMNPKHPTGGGAIAALLRSPTCPLRTLNLSWNSIRSSGIPIAKALAVNNTVTHLDLSYNSLGNEGAEVLGNSLHYNSALVTLDLTQTKVQARSCYVIVQGIYSCPTLRHLILSENPIGDVGLRSVMSLHMKYTSEELKVDIRGCNFKMQDVTATFDPKHVSGIYKLDLTKAYDRAICIGLSREVAARDDVCFAEYKYNGLPMKFEVRKRNKIARVVPENALKAKEAAGENGRETSDQNEAVRTSGDIERKEDKEDESTPLSDESERKGEDENASTEEVVGEGQTTTPVVDILSISEDIDHAALMFKKYDTDDSGGIDRQELMNVLKELGLSNTIDVVDELMEQYDADGGGVIELQEFREFLQAVQLSAAKNQTFDNEERYLVDDLQSSDIRAPEYAIADEGVVECTVNTGQTIPEFIQAMSAEKLDSLLNAAQESSDSFAILQAAVSSTKLKATEAKRVYRALLKDSGDMVQSLKMVIPNCYSSADARALIAYAHPGSVTEICRIKASLGRLYDVCVGVPNGYYHLKFEDEQDRSCFDKLVEISAAAKDMRARTDQCDNSQYGDWSSFRKVLINNEPSVIDDDFLISIPEMGTISFDFVVLHDYAFHKMDSALSNRRLHKILNNIRMLDGENNAELKNFQVFDEKVSKLDDDGKVSSKGVGTRYWEISADVCADFTAKQDAMFANLPFRNARGDMREEESLREVSALEEEYLNGVDGSRPTTNAEDMRRSDGDATLHTDEKISDNVLGLYQSHLSLLSRSSANEFNPQMVSYRTLEALIEALASRYITCAQLAYLVRLFPHSSISLCRDSAAKPEDEDHAKEATESPASVSRAGKEGGEECVDANDGTDKDGNKSVDIKESILNAVRDGANAGSEEGPFVMEKIEELAERRRAKENEGIAEKQKHEGEDEGSGITPEAATEELVPESVEEEDEDEEEEEEEEEPFCGYSTVRVDLVIKLFSNVVDKLNMDNVLRFISPAEIAMIVFRLGYLNVFNTLKPEGFWRLNMSRRDEKQFVRALILLSFAEPGQNWQCQSFQEPQKKEDDTWTLPLSWFHENTLPKGGVVKLKYVSSDPLGTSEEQFKPDFSKRAVLTCISQSQPYATDAKFAKKSTAKNAQMMITEEFGVQLSLTPLDEE